MVAKNSGRQPTCGCLPGLLLIQIALVHRSELSDYSVILAAVDVYRNGLAARLLAVRLGANNARCRRIHHWPVGEH